MTYILIWWLTFGYLNTGHGVGVATHSQEFATEALCLAAKDHLARSLSLGQLTVGAGGKPLNFALICVQKGE